MKESKAKQKLWMLAHMLKNYMAVVLGIHMVRYFTDMDNFTWSLTPNELILLVSVFVTMELIEIKNKLIDKE